jgi:DNA-binding response OmpR family regulator
MSESNGQPTVLVADDDDDVLGLVAIRLEHAGYRVLTASDGEEALNTARESLPALAVLDVVMPKLTGIEVARALREDDATRRIRIILLTASVQEDDVQRGFEAGADEYVRKPFDFQELRARVEALLESR